MTATQPDSERKFTRRGVMKTTAVGIGSAASLGTVGVSPASAVAPIVVGAAAGGVALGYLMKKGVDVFTGSEKDYSSYTGFDALKRNAYEDMLEAKSVDERVMTSIENNLKSSENVAIAKAKAALVKKLNNGASESEANNAMNNALSEYYANIQKNILTHYEAQMSKIQSIGNALCTHPDSKGGDSGGSDVFKVGALGDTRKGAKSFGSAVGALKDNGTESIDLVNGNQFDIAKYEIRKSGYTGNVKWRHKTTDANDEPIPYWEVTNPDGGASALYGFRRVYSAFDKVVTKFNDVNSQLVGLSADLFSEYGPGDIPTEDVLDPTTAATELGNNTGLGIREAQAGMMGIPTSAGFSLRLELTNNDGSSYEVDAEIYTNAQPNDSSGNPAGFAVGETYDPANFEAPIYVSYEYIDPETGEESSDFTQVQNPFTVLEATDENGNEVEEVTPTSRTQQTTDVSKIEEELASIREEQQRLLQKSQKPTGGGGGFLSGDLGSDTRTLGIVAGGAALAALLFGGNN